MEEGLAARVGLGTAGQQAGPAVEGGGLAWPESEQRAVLTPGARGQWPYSSHGHRKLPGNWDLQARENASKIPWAFSSLVNQVSIYRHGNMRGERTGRKFTKC